MAEPIFWSMVAVNVAWLALNVWHTRENWCAADDNLRQARETAALPDEQARTHGVMASDGGQQK